MVVDLDAFVDAFIRGVGRSEQGVAFGYRVSVAIARSSQRAQTPARSCTFACAPGSRTLARDALPITVAISPLPRVRRNSRACGPPPTFANG
ncbi:MAG: hypothetical protein ACLGI5_02435, partial [Thermoleophilia bacterium]